MKITRRYFSAQGASVALDFPMFGMRQSSNRRTREGPRSGDFNKLVIEITSNPYKRFSYPC